MGLARTIATAAVLAGCLGLGLAVLPGSALAAEDQGVATEGRLIPLPLPVRSGTMTEGEASRMLLDEGFEVVQSGRTLLGRIRIVAEGPQGRREIVLHPGDGRVLRDILTEAPPSATTRDAVIVEVVPAAPQNAPQAADPVAAGSVPQTPPAAPPVATAPASAPVAPPAAAPGDTPAGADRGAATEDAGS